MDSPFVMWAATSTLGIVGWALRLESKVTQEAIQREALKELISSKLDGIAQRLGRIEKGMNGHLPREEEDDHEWHN